MTLLGFTPCGPTPFLEPSFSLCNLSHRQTLCWGFSGFSISQTHPDVCSFYFFHRKCLLAHLCLNNSHQQPALMDSLSQSCLNFPHKHFCLSHGRTFGAATVTSASCGLGVLPFLRYCLTLWSDLSLLEGGAHLICNHYHTLQRASGM